MNMLLGLLKGLMPDSGDYRVLWQREGNQLTVTLWKIEPDENSAVQVGCARIDWPKK